MSENNSNGLFSLLVVGGSLLFVSVFIAYTIISRPTDGVPSSSLGIQSVARSTQVSAFIGEFRFTLTGFTSPFARVIFEGQGIYDETYADKFGAFTFLNKFSPLSPREACLTAQDTDGRISKPVCLPPFSVQKNVIIGPILLPPTVSVNQDIYVAHDYGVMSGKAAPESTVAIDLYTDTSAQKVAVTAVTDATGDYSLTLPTERESTIRTFSLNMHKNLTSDTSNVLTLHILPLWLLLVRQFGLLLMWLMRFWLPLILGLEGLILCLMLFGKKKSKHQPLVKQAL